MEHGFFDSERRSFLFRNPDFVFPLLLVVLGILFFADPLFSSKNFFFRDILNFHLPLRKVMIDSYAQGNFPLWNPRIFLGQPMLANPNYMALYPTIILNLVIPFAYAFKLHFIIHAILAGIGMFFLLRRIGIIPVAALAGSIAYQFSGTVISMLNLYNIAPCPALLPWIGWAFLGCLNRFCKKRILGFGALFGLQIMLLEPLMMQCALWLIAAITAVYFLEAERKREALKVLTKVVLWGGLCAVGLAAIQLLPSLELLRHSVRGKGYDSAFISYWSMHPADLLNIVIPSLFGKLYTLGGNLYWGEKFHSAREGYFISLFMGSTVFLLALLSFFSLRKKLQTVVACLTAISIVFALGQFGGVYLWLCKWLPIFRFGRYPVKYMLLTSLVFCILAALGLEAVLDRRSGFHTHRTRVIMVLTIGMLISGVCLGVSFYIPSHSSGIQDALRSWIIPDRLKVKDIGGISKQLSQSFRWAGLFCLISLMLVFFVQFRKRCGLIGPLIVFALSAELLAQNVGLSPLLSGADFGYISEVDRYVTPAPNSGPHRVYHIEQADFIPVKQIWAPNQSVAWLYLVLRRSGHPIFGVMNGVEYSITRSVDDLNTNESNEIFWKSLNLKGEDYVKLLGRVNSTTILTLGEIDSPQVAFAKSFYTGSDRKISVYRLKNPMPRAYFVANTHWAASPEKALDCLLDSKFPYEKTVILEGSGFPDVKSDVTGNVRVLNYENNAVRCEVESGGKGYLVLLDSYYPGWRATLDGSHVEIRRANYAFRAVEVPPGKHIVEFRYRPISFYLGCLITIITLFVGTGVWFGARRSGEDEVQKLTATNPVTEQ
jgi:hypothetical protein